MLNNRAIYSVLQYWNLLNKNSLKGFGSYSYKLISLPPSEYKAQHAGTTSAARQFQTIAQLSCIYRSRV